jgi:exopolysaccharide production protein ExoZ
MSNKPMPPAAASPRASLVNIQYLRAIAALMVVWVHAREQFSLTFQLFPSAVGSHGVDLFFVISGFIMVYTTHGKPGAPGQFLLRRFLRIAPLYWLITLTIVAIALLAPQLLKSTQLVPAHVLASLAFIPMQSPAFPDYLWPLLVPGWTLNYEMAFYALFALCLWLPARWRTPALCGVLLGLVALGRATDPGGVPGFYTDAIVLAFGTGAVLGELYCRGLLQRLGFTGGLLALLAGVALWLAGQSLPLPHRFIAAGIPATLVVLGACAIGPIASPGLKWLEKLGDATYSIYLGHVLLLGALRFACNKLDFAVTDLGSALCFMAMALIVSALGGWLLYRCVETPIADRLAAWTRR